jgi:hypothetical protein
MSNFSQFFKGAAGAAAGVAGNILAGIRPPKMSALGNPHNYSTVNRWMVENLLIPNHSGYILALNYGYKVTVATWQNTLVWYVDDGSLGTGSVIGAFLYNPVLDKWYLSSTGAASGNGVYEVNILTGARTLVKATVPAFMTTPPYYGSKSYVDADGNYVWRDGDTIRKYSQAFVEIQRRTIVAAANLNDGNWYYTEDCKIRAQSLVSWRGQGTASSTNVTPDVPQLLIERLGSRRLINLTAEEVFSARSYGLDLSTMTPVTPSNTTGAYYGGDVRLGGRPRDSAAIADSFILDRVDYDRWLSDVANALGMPASTPFYGDWTNV